MLKSGKRVPLSPERHYQFPVWLCHCLYHRSLIPSLLHLTPSHLHGDWKLGVTGVGGRMNSATCLESNNGEEQRAADFSSRFRPSWWEPSAFNFIWKVFPKGRIKFHIKRRNGIKCSSYTNLKNTDYSCEPPDCYPSGKPLRETLLLFPKQKTRERTKEKKKKTAWKVCSLIWVHQDEQWRLHKERRY